MATTDRFRGFNMGVAVKPACAVASTGNITLSSTQTIDGIAVGSGERVLVGSQTDASENGIYISDSSTWTRAADFDGSKDAIPGTIVYVDRGTNYATSFWTFNSSSTATEIDIGTDDITVSRVDIALAGVSAFSNTLLSLGTAVAWKSTSGLVLGSAADENIGNSSTNVPTLSSTGNIWSGIQSWEKGADIASANTITLGSTGNYFDITGGVTINQINAVSRGTVVRLHFDSTNVLTNSTSLVLPTDSNVITEADDEIELIQYTTAADWRCTNYLRKTGAPPAKYNSPLRGHIDGLILQNSTADADHDIIVNLGGAADSSAYVIMELTSLLTKQIDSTWAVGTNQGGLDGTESTSGFPDTLTTYHVHLIRRNDTGAVDAIFSENATAPTFPSTVWDQSRRIGAVGTDGSANILSFIQRGDYFYYSSALSDYNTTGTTARTLRKLSVPKGLKVWPIMHHSMTSSILANSVVTDPDLTDINPDAFPTVGLSGSGAFDNDSALIGIMTDSSGYIGTRESSGSNITIRGITRGWIDPRGKDL